MSGKIGKNTVNVSANVDRELREELRALAQASGIGISQYVERVLIAAAEAETVLQMREDFTMPLIKPAKAVSYGASSKPKARGETTGSGHSSEVVKKTGEMTQKALHAHVQRKRRAK